ncbi:hypothetical protein [Polyangium fumosum]|uniref:Uncharacterized protein n=1 Tax=Polyangium fumosum TaxID=889272 RepID=A0A4U1J9I4_9BACT|nr:hypothetical protein [Polyangium fumosum]TKD05055.1 hypothetical protein E8A74_22585 [Polyangium fumosum]
MTLDALVTSPGDMERWLVDMERALGYVRDEQRSAEPYKASMAGRLRHLLGSARIQQKELLEQEPIDAVGGFEAALAEKAMSDKDPLVAEIAVETISMGAVQGILDRVTQDVGPLSAAYADLAADFVAYRETESAELDTYIKLVAKASMATVLELDGIETVILEAAHDASAGPQEMVLRAMKLSAETVQFEVTSQETLSRRTLISWSRTARRIRT